MADFEKASQIRKGELDAELPDYEEITGWLQRVPVTWLPGILIAIVQQCVIRNVFQPGGLERIVRAAACKTGPGSELRNTRRHPMPINLRPIAYGTGLTVSTDGKLRIRPIDTKYDYEITIQARPGYDCVRWSINREMQAGVCLNRDGDWEREPIPSSRDDDFFARCRYASLDEAREWLEKVMEGQSK